MSIDIEVGIFVDCDEEEDSQFREYYLQQFEAINRFLRSIGLPEHQEPKDLGGQPSFDRRATREIFPFKEHSGQRRAFDISTTFAEQSK